MKINKTERFLPNISYKLSKANRLIILTSLIVISMQFNEVLSKSEDWMPSFFENILEKRSLQAVGTQILPDKNRTLSNGIYKNLLIYKICL